MIYRGWWLALLAAWLCLWEETGQNPFVFCYRIGSGACCGLVTQAHVLVSLRKRTDFDRIRKISECSTPSSISSMHCSILKDSRN